MLSALQLDGDQLERYSNGCLGFERSLPENPALMKAYFIAGINMIVKMNAAREKPTEACSG